MRWFPVTLVCVLSAAGCGSDEIEHDEFGGVGEVGGSSFSTGVAFEGNYPEPAHSRCGPLPPDTPPLDGLMSAWGVLALPGARSADGDEIETGTLRLRLGDHPLADCAQTFQPDEGFCQDAGVEGLECGWGIGLTLHPDELQAGTYELTEMTDSQYAVSTETGRDASRDGRSGTLVVYAATPDCIVGELQDVEVRAGEPMQVGGFVAELCQRQCVPSPGAGC